MMIFEKNTATNAENGKFLISKPVFKLIATWCRTADFCQNTSRKLPSSFCQKEMVLCFVVLS